VQCRFVDFSAQTKRKFARFDFLRVAQLHFDRHRTDHRHPVAVINDALYKIDQELPLVLEGGRALKACPRSVAELPDADLDAFFVVGAIP
jgi:hypothetical protein